jgi:hypothetical protein
MSIKHIDRGEFGDTFNDDIFPALSRFASYRKVIAGGAINIGDVVKYDVTAVSGAFVHPLTTVAKSEAVRDALKVVQTGNTSVGKEAPIAGVAMETATSGSTFIICDEGLCVVNWAGTVAGTAGDPIIPGAVTGSVTPYQSWVHTSGSDIGTLMQGAPATGGTQRLIHLRKTGW